jgi:hypothetical protein
MPAPVLAEPEGCVCLFVDEGAPIVELLRQASGSALAYVPLLLAACRARVAGGAE